MNKPMHIAQLAAVEKLKRLRVGALYIDRQSGKFRTVSALVRIRFEKGKIDGVLWLCTHRRREMILQECGVYLAEYAERIRVFGIESLSHSVKLFVDALGCTRNAKMMLIIDNGLLVKNMKALRTLRVIELANRCPYRLLISDMPFTKNIADMFSQWYALDPRILGYQTLYGFMINHVGAHGEARNTEYISAAIDPFSAQVLREEVQETSGKREYVFPFELPKAVVNEYREVLNRFLRHAFYSRTGVYRLLQACQQVISGRRVVCDYPLKTEPIYGSDREDARLQALLEAVWGFEANLRILIFYKYRYELQSIRRALCARYGADAVYIYDKHPDCGARFTLMNLMQDEFAQNRLCADVIIYYSNDWNWQKREEKERRCQTLLKGRLLQVVNLVAVNTLEMKILKSVWKKENLVTKMRKALQKRGSERGKGYAEDLQ